MRFLGLVFELIMSVFIVFYYAVDEWGMPDKYAIPLLVGLFFVDIFGTYFPKQESKKNQAKAAEKPTYTKIANDGSELPDNAQIGSGAKDWACTKDNNTGLIWEVKTTDYGLRDMAKTYTNYSADSADYGAETNADCFVIDVNSQGLCGANDWRMPTIDELLGIVKNGNTPAIDTTYFPNTPSDYFWSSSPYDYNRSGAWVVNFSDGYSNFYGKNGNFSVRLVRSDKTNQ